MNTTCFLLASRGVHTSLSRFQSLDYLFVGLITLLQNHNLLFIS